MKKNRNILRKIYIVIFMSLLVLPWLFWGVTALVDEKMFLEMSDISKENRTKNELDLSSLAESGESLSLYVNDRVPYRRALIDIYQLEEGKADILFRDTVNFISRIFNGEDSTVKQAGDVNDLFSEEPETTTSAPVVYPSSEPSDGTHIHNYEVVERVEPTCTKEGYFVYKCTDCKDKYTETLPIVPHDKMLVAESEASYITYGYKDYVCRVCGKRIREDFVPKMVDVSYMAPQILNENTIVGRFNWLFFAGNNSISYYKGSNLLSDESLQKYAEMTNHLKELCDARGIELYLMFMPNKEQVYSEYLPTIEVEDEYKRTQRLVDYLNTNTSVPVVYPLEELKAADAYWQVYCKYDTHWNRMGAFFGLQALYKVMGMELTNPLYENIFTTDPGRYDLISLGGLSLENFPPDYDYVVDYKPEIIANGLEILASPNRVTSTSTNSKRFVMLSDSYREGMAAYIVKDFAQCTLAHRDNTMDCKEDILNANILVLTAVERHDTRLFTCMEKVISILEEN